MVAVLEDQDPLTPAGKPLNVAPVAPVVVWVTPAIAILTHSVGDEEATLAVLAGVTVMVPVALTLLHPPVSGME